MKDYAEMGRSVLRPTKGTARTVKRGRDRDSCKLRADEDATGGDGVGCRNGVGSGA
jgi:hypothetical protein